MPTQTHQKTNSDGSGKWVQMQKLSRTLHRYGRWEMIKTYNCDFRFGCEGEYPYHVYVTFRENGGFFYCNHYDVTARSLQQMQDVLGYYVAKDILEKEHRTFNHCPKNKSLGIPNHIR